MAAPKQSHSVAELSGAVKGRAEKDGGGYTIVVGQAKAGPGSSVSFTGLRRLNPGRSSRLKPGSVYLEIGPAVAGRLLSAKGLRLDVTEGSQAKPPSQENGENDEVSPALRTALEQAYSRADDAIAEILARPDMLSSDKVARRFGVTRETVNQWRRKGDLLGLEGDARGVRYPEWQIINGRRIPRLRDLGGFFGKDPWSVYRFLVTRHDALDDETALEAVRAGRLDEVLALAESICLGAPL